MLINLTFGRIPPSLAAIVLTFFLGCASTGPRNGIPPVTRGTSQPYPALAAHVYRFLPDTLFPPSNAGIMIYSLTNREVLFALNPDLLFAPASNQKIATAAAALELLPPEFMFATEFFIDSVDGRRVIVRGAGDPLLDTGDLDSIAAAISDHIDTSHIWDIVADPSLFDNVQWGKGWMWDDDPYNSPVSALSVNGNVVEILVRPGPVAGEPTIAVATDPAVTPVLFNRSTTGLSGRADSLVFHRINVEGIDQIHIDGTIGPGRKEASTGIAVHDPVRHFLRLFSRSLAAHGVKCGSTTTGPSANNGTSDFICSRAVDSVLHVMLKESDNLCAENLFRMLGRSVTGEPGSTEGGILAVKTALHLLGVDTARIVTADGSGVSRYNLLTAGTVVRILEAVYERPGSFDRFYQSLPVAGVDGTLSTRMKGTPAQGNLRAKTGTLRGASSLSGYVTTLDGELLAFSLLMQNYPTGPKDYRSAQDSIGVFLSTLRRSDF
jgi:D-alanyl-D-alanine carboxypeptidase/D-alanyl-D-alanine-endopeptidase (penicillin-binding protein 4)